MNTKEKADALVEKHKPYAYVSIHFAEVMKYEHTLNATKCAIISVEHTIEVLERIKRTDFEASRLLHVTSQIELDEQTELLNELKSRL